MDIQKTSATTRVDYVLKRDFFKGYTITTIVRVYVFGT